MDLRLKLYGDPVLRKKTEPVTEFGENLDGIIESMHRIMIENNGVGLAGPQAGLLKQIFLIDESGGEGEPQVFINPEISGLSEEYAVEEEGCLSFPGIYIDIKRPSKASLRAQNRRGEWFEVRDAQGLIARAFQHETDHLNGILFIDRISPVKKALISKKLKGISKNSTKRY